MSEAKLLDWPAFSSVKSLPSKKILVERGVWGKVPGASTDYRWIARSDGLESGGLAEQISLGTEDEPVKAPLWLCQGHRYYATGLYPSRAWDAAGRSGFLEKQVLAWTRPPGAAAALGALLLLDHVASLNADVWWPHREAPSWSDAEFSLRLDPEELDEPLQEKLESLVDQGVAELERAVERQSLGDLYAQILARRKPVYLTGLREPLSPLALAVLLLPLPRNEADLFSLAGWIPSKRAPLETLGTRWSVIVLPPHLADAARGRDLDAQTKREGWDIAQALLDLDPEGAKIAAMPLAVQQSPPPPGTPPPARRPPEPPLVHHGPALTPLDAQRPNARIALPAPPPFLEELHAFAGVVDRRWLDLERWTRNPISQLEPIDENLFPSWIATLQQQKPGHVDDEQWTVKLDLLRSAALVLRPKTDPLQGVGFPVSRRVPALLFSLYVSRHLLAEMDREILRKALQHSLSLEPNPWTRRLKTELVEWPTPKKASWLRALIQSELDEAARPVKR